MLGRSAAMAPNMLPYHCLRDCCRLRYRCSHKDRVTNHGGEKLPVTHSQACLCCHHCCDGWHASQAEVAGTIYLGFPGGFEQPAVSCCGCRNAEGPADTAAGGRGTRRAGRCGLELQSSAWPPSSISVQPLPTESVRVGAAALRQRQGCKSTRRATSASRVNSAVSYSFSWGTGQHLFTTELLTDPGWVALEFPSLAFIFKELSLWYSAQHKRSEYIRFTLAENSFIPHNKRRDITVTMDGEQERLLPLSEMKKVFEISLQSAPKEGIHFQAFFSTSIYF